MNKKLLVLLGVLLIALLVYASVVLLSGSSDNSTNTNTADTTSSVLVDQLTVKDQAAGDSLVVDGASLKKGGYAYAATTKGIVGNSAYLKAGKHTLVSIKIYDSQKLKAGEKVTLALISDDGDQKYGAADVKLAVNDSTGEPIQRTITLK